MHSDRPKLSRRTLAGLGFIYLAGIGWLAEFIIPFLTLGHKGRIWVGVLIAAEICFVIGVAIMGRPVYEHLKAMAISIVGKRTQKDPRKPF